MPVGVGGAGALNKRWVLTDLDRGDDIVGQFVPQSLTKSVSSVVAEASSVNRDHPILQWVQGATETVSFTAKLWAKDSTDFSVEDRLFRLETLVRRNSDLKRPPVCSFSWGAVGTLLLDCLVQSIGEVTYDEVREDGTLRGVTLQLTLKRFEEVEFTVTDPSVPETFTRVRRAKRNDTYESIALDEYGDPQLGVLLRQLTPRVPGMLLADLRPKDPVHIFPEEFLVTLEIAPEFHAFRTGSGNEAAEQRRREIFDARAADAYVTVFSDTAGGEFL